MKLLRLNVNSDFRSLKAGFEIRFREVSDTADFSEFHPFCFAGLNGSGKSNVLEALSNIFFFLESCAISFKPDSFRDSFDESHNLNGPDAFELEYLIDLDPRDDVRNYADGFYEVSIIKEIGKRPVMTVGMINSSTREPMDVVMPIVAQSSEDTAPGKAYLPDLVVGYSSGENETLSIPFIKARLIQYDEYVKAITDNHRYLEPAGGLLYIDSEMSQAVLLSILLFYDDKVIKPLKDELGIEGINSFRIRLKNFFLSGWENEKGDKTRFMVLDQIKDQIEKLRKCSTINFTYKPSDTENWELEYLDFYVDYEMKRAFRDHFKDAFELFRLFQILYTLNYRTVGSSIKKDIYSSKGFHTGEKMGKPNPEDQVFHFLDFYIWKKTDQSSSPKPLLLREFSDGEHQYLHTMGICLMLQNRRTLLLLDEPETHFNPDWRSKFINVLDKSITAGGGNNLLKDILLTSHSPFIISDCLPNNVFFFSKSKGDKLVVKSAEELGLKTYGSSVDYIMKNFFDTGLIPKKAQEHLKEVIETGNLEELELAVEQFGSSSYKQFLFRRIYELTKDQDDNDTEEIYI